MFYVADKQYVVNIFQNTSCKHFICTIQIEQVSHSSQRDSNIPRFQLFYCLHGIVALYRETELNTALNTY